MLSHPFIYQVLNFFGFGENFKKWVKLLCTNRKACITLEGGKVSRTFNLLRGNAQGDILSPFIFILCYQILIFKIQFDLQIIGFVSSPVADGHSSINCLPAEAIYITWFTMARQLETSRIGEPPSAPPAAVKSFQREHLRIQPQRGYSTGQALRFCGHRNHLATGTSKKHLQK